MGAIRGQFGGLNTDLPFSKVPSGTAREAVNVTVRNGQLQKRAGFSEYESAVDRVNDSVLNLFCAHFADGDVYLIAKIQYQGTPDVGKLYYTQIYDGSTKAATSISWQEMDITTSTITLSDTEPGWAFMWRDRWHYFDGSTFGVRWNPDVNSAKAYRAGMPQGFASVASAAAGGQKVGKYHVHAAYRNSTTQEEGTVSAPGDLVDTRPGDSTGGIAVASVTLPANYEVDSRHIYCTMGNTEHIEDGGTSVTCYSYKAYPDAIRTDGNAVGLNKADHVLSKELAFTNAGGLPPASKCGTWTGQHAIYGGLSVGGKMMFSVPGYPTSVPQTVTYSVGGDTKTFWPKPWVGEAFGFDGPITSIKSTGGLVALYTPTSTYQARAGGNGKLFPVQVHQSYGVASSLAACAAGPEIHALGNGSWTIARMDGIGNLAQERFTTTLAEIPAGYERLSSMAYYGYHDEVWCVVVKSGETAARRILVWDRPRQALVKFDHAALLDQEGITCLCEVSIPSETPFMLAATDRGRIFKYPDGVDDDDANFAASWKGVFAVERCQYSQKLTGIELQAGSNVSGNVTMGVRVKRASGDTVDQKTMALGKDNGLILHGFAVDRIDGRMIELELSSDATVDTQWTIHDVTIKTERTDLK